MHSGPNWQHKCVHFHKCIITQKLALLANLCNFVLISVFGDHLLGLSTDRIQWRNTRFGPFCRWKMAKYSHFSLLCLHFAHLYHYLSPWRHRPCQNGKPAENRFYLLNTSWLACHTLCIMIHWFVTFAFTLQEMMFQFLGFVLFLASGSVVVDRYQSFKGADGDVGVALGSMTIITGIFFLVDFILLAKDHFKKN